MRYRKIISIYFSGFLVGIILVLYPAAGSLFTSPDFHDISSAQFGSIFIPQIILAIITSLLAPKLSDRWNMKSVMILGLISLLLSALILAATQLFLDGNFDYILLLIGTAFLGAGFGFTITALNPFAFNLFPGKETSAVTAMHILLGAGTASAALFLNYFVGLSIWYMAPLIISGVVLFMLLFTFPLPLSLPPKEKEESDQKGIPIQIWMFAFAVFLYGACEATFGNWGALFLEKSGGLSASDAALGLSLFWGFIAIGRILFTFYALRFTPKWVYIIAPFIVVFVFYLLPSANSKNLLLTCMVIGGLGMSVLFPVSISMATERYPKYAALISGLLVAAIQLGTGFSSNIIGLLNESMPLGKLFQYSAIYALLFSIMAILLSLKKQNDEYK